MALCPVPYALRRSVATHMAKTSKTLELIVRMKQTASREAKKIDRALVQVRKRAQALPGAIFNIRNALMGAGLGLIAKDLIGKHTEQARAVAGVETAMKSMGNYTPELSKKLQTLAAGLQKVTNFGDEATQQGQKFLITYRDITDELLDRSTQAMLDLAALMRGDVVGAANMLGKASMGMTGELRRAGITVDSQTYKLEGYVGVLAAIESQVKGQARAMRKATGPWIAIGNAIGDTKEQLGKLLDLKVAPTVDRWIKKFEGFTKTLKDGMAEATLRAEAEEAWEKYQEQKPESGVSVLIKKQIKTLGKVRKKWAEESNKFLYEKDKFIAEWIKQRPYEQQRFEMPYRAPEKKPEEASGIAREKSRLGRLKAATQTSLALLTKTYKDGEIVLTEYFDRRKALIERQFAEELKALEKSAASEKDPTKRLAIEDQVFARQEAHKKALIELTAQQGAAEKALAQKKLDIQDMLADLRIRAAESAAGTMKAQFDVELAEMDRRHQEEIDRLNKLKAEKEAIDEAYRLQKIEKDRLLVDQERRLHEQRLQNAQTIASGMSGIFGDLYEMSGKKMKAFFYLQKTAAMAEAYIQTELGATKALGQAGMFGIPMSSIIRGLGYASIAIMAAQTFGAKLAAGGSVPGYSPSPTADNIPLWGTAGEYMQPVAAVKHYGRPIMEAIKNRLIPKELFAGLNIPVPSMAKPSYALAGGGSVPDGHGGYSVYVPVSVYGARDPDGVARSLQVEIEKTAIRVMREQMS